MPNQEAVESFKITPEMKGFLKTYKAYNKIGERLRNKMQIQLDETAQTRQMLQQVEKGMQMLTMNAPEKPTYEVPEQEQEAETINPMLNY